MTFFASFFAPLGLCVRKGFGFFKSSRQGAKNAKKYKNIFRPKFFELREISDKAMHENEIAKIVVDAAFKVHQTLGPGLFESVYETVLAYELKERGLSAERQKTVPIEYEGQVFDEGF